MRQAIEFWDREVAARTHISWMESDAVRRYINRSVSGEETVWPIEWLHRRFPRHFVRGLSIGCGAGALERVLIERGICGRVDAFDGSLSSLATAARDETAAGLHDRVRYYAADFNRPALPRNVYDVVFVHQALHHVAELELLYTEILKALKPDGLLYIDEYVGPSRFDWDDRLFATHRAIYDTLPREVRRQAFLLMPIQPDDPSEGYRSSDIVPLLTVGFDIIERRDYGGNLLAVFFPEIDWSAASPELVSQLIETETRFLKNGAEPFHSVFVARPKSGDARAAALRAYAVRARTSRVYRGVRAVVRAAIHFKRRVGAFVKQRVRRER